MTHDYYHQFFSTKRIKLREDFLRVVFNDRKKMYRAFSNFELRFLNSDPNNLRVPNYKSIARREESIARQVDAIEKNNFWDYSRDIGLRRCYLFRTWLNIGSVFTWHMYVPESFFCTFDTCSIHVLCPLCVTDNLGLWATMCVWIARMALVSAFIQATWISKRKINGIWQLFVAKLVFFFFLITNLVRLKVIYGACECDLAALNDRVVLQGIREFGLNFRCYLTCRKIFRYQ